MSKFVKKMRHGFTLVEIMIVVLIIGVLLAIAVPNFIKARESSRTKACIANMKQIDSAKEQWAMDNNKSDGATVTMANLTGATAYIKSEPKCPSGTASYSPGNVGTNPACPNIATATTHVLP